MCKIYINTSLILLVKHFFSSNSILLYNYYLFFNINFDNILKKYIMKLKQLFTFLLITSFLSTNAQENKNFIENSRVNFDIGLGNKEWSYGELTLVNPIVEKDNSLFALGLNYMFHFGNENSESNEKTLGLIYRKKINDGNAFIGLNASYSLYTTWDGNNRQTPHIGFELVHEKFSILANYMFQDKTIHSHESPTNDFHTVYTNMNRYQNIYSMGEAFSGGWEILANYHISNKFSLGAGYYDRFGDENNYVASVAYSIQDPTINNGNEINFNAEHNLSISHLLHSGMFIEAEYQTNFANFGLQFKSDTHQNFLGMFTARIPIGKNSKNDAVNANMVDRLYYSPVYKADPDDFGLSLLIGFAVDGAVDAIIGAIADAAVDGSLEAAMDAAGFSAEDIEGVISLLNAGRNFSQACQILGLLGL